MKKLNIKFWAGLFAMLLVASSCEDALDINENPNNPIAADVQLVLPQAIVATASLSNQFNSYGGHFGGFISNAGGFSGFGNLLNYNLTPGDWNGLWVNTYQDPLKDLKYVIDNSKGVDELSYFNAAAKILTVVNYQRLVDAFGDVPFSQALRAEEGITAPTYDDGATIYQELFAKLDTAISTIDNAKFPLRLTPASDPLFGGTTERNIEDQMMDWKRYANTLKLRILIRLSSKTQFDTFVTQGFANLNLTLGFLRSDAIVNPGYELNRPNPEWATWGKTVAGALANSSRIPTEFSFGFYNGSKISDPARGETIFVNFPNTPVNQLGNEDGSPTIVAGQVTWASNQDAITENDNGDPLPVDQQRPSFIGTGVLKGPGQGQPLMLKAESDFLVAEAQLNNFISGGLAGVTASYYNGMRSSFAYLFKNESGAMIDTTTWDKGPIERYLEDNDGNPLVEIQAATTFDQRLEAIITQKYIALLMINSDEAWNEYRRTGYPATQPGGDPEFDIASNKSNANARADRLPTRILYPSSEQSYNSVNYRMVNHVGDLIFWDPN